MFLMVPIFPYVNNDSLSLGRWVLSIPTRLASVFLDSASVVNAKTWGGGGVWAARKLPALLFLDVLTLLLIGERARKEMRAGKFLNTSHGDSAHFSASLVMDDQSLSRLTMLSCFLSGTRDEEETITLLHIPLHSSILHFTVFSLGEVGRYRSVFLISSCLDSVAHCIAFFIFSSHHSNSITFTHLIRNAKTRPAAASGE